MNELRILNLYAGIGGNRKLWSDKHDITAVEYDPKIADIYKHYYPNDKVIVADAHKFLIDNYKEYDFIWASPPCPTHSRLVTSWQNNPRFERLIKYPDMSLYQEIIFLKHIFKGYFVVENVIPYYKSLITPSIELHRHLFWSNFRIEKKKFYDKTIVTGSKNAIKVSNGSYGFDIKNFNHSNKVKLLRNMVNPEVAKHIFDCLELEIWNKNNRLFNE
jgi:DNA (cytosine-5)-methyltransferase 1